jgi:membrane associated rhomboid family serine protease
MITWASIFLLEFQLGEDDLREIQNRFGLLPGRFINALAAMESESWGPFFAAFGRFLEVGVLPLFTYQFLHADVVHLLSNLLFFWVFASRLETRFGSWRFLVFFLFSGVVAGLAQTYLGVMQWVVTIGASGGIAGTMSAYMCLFWRSRILLLIPVFVVPIFVEVAAPILVLGWFALQFRPVMKLFGLGPGEPIAWYAHIGGFLAGLVFLPIAVLSTRWRRERKSSAHASAGASR